MKKHFQRIGAISNAHVGRDFEEVARRILASKRIKVEKKFSVRVGVSRLKKVHCFDMGSSSPPVLVECKSHRWTSGGNVPSAKITVWNEAMYYFACAPKSFRKILFVLKDLRKSSGESLATYYVRTYEHLIPANVEIWEVDEASSKLTIIRK
jgi:hypothetical protein